MASKAQKKVMEQTGKQVADRVGDLLETVEEKLRDDAGLPPKGSGGRVHSIQTGSPEMDKVFNDFAEQHETITVKIHRKNDKGAWEMFVNQTGVKPSDLAEEGLDVRCANEGGMGEYKVTLIPPTPGKKKSFPGIHVGGLPRRTIAKSLEDQAGGFGMVSPWGGAPNTTPWGNQLPMANAMQAGKTVDMTKGFLNHMKNSNDQMMAVQSQGQQQFMQLMGMMMMRDGTNGSGGQNDVMLQRLEQAEKERAADQRRFQEQLEQERQRQREDEKRREDTRRLEDQIKMLTQQMTENKTNNTIEAMKMNQGQGQDRDKTWLQMLEMSRQDARASKDEQQNWFKFMMDRPDASDKITKLAESQTQQTVHTLNLLTQIATSGILGEGSNSPIRDAFADMIRQVPDAINGVIGGLQEGAGYPEEQQEVPTMNLPPGQIQVQQPSQPPAPPQPESPLTTSQEMEQAQQGEVPTVDPTQPPEQTPPELQEAIDKAMLSPEELQKFTTDSALVKVLERIKQGKTSEATQRLFAHAEIHGQGWGADVARRWLMFPHQLSAQILQAHGFPQGADPVAQDIMNFWQFMQGGGDPNEWSDTGYKPVKPRRVQMGVAPSQGPEFGVSKAGPPADAKPYDASVPPPGVSEEEVERQRQKRRDDAEAAKVKEKEELDQALVGSPPKVAPKKKPAAKKKPGPKKKKATKKKAPKKEPKKVEKPAETS